MPERPFPSIIYVIGGPQARATRLKLKKLLALIGAISEQPSILNDVEDEIAGRCDDSAAEAAPPGVRQTSFWITGSQA
jgi:hypothetical protein